MPIVTDGLLRAPPIALIKPVELLNAIFLFNV